MKVLSLFDGISCGMVALERAGIPVDTYYASEIDKNAIAISQKNYPNIIRLGDVTKWREWDIPWTEIDLLIGGSPCQGFSFAGKQLNFNDPRSKLFFEFVDILNNIKKHNQNVKFLLENVCMKKEYEDVISDCLKCKPTCIDSEVITPMRRKRLYWFNFDAVEIAKRHCCLKDILENDVDQKYFKNEEQFNKITYTENGTLYIKNLPNKKMPVQEYDGVVLSRTWQTYMPLVKQKSHAIRAANPDDVGVCVPSKNGLRFRKFTLSEMEKMQTLPVGYTKVDGISERKSKATIGNGWTVDVIAHIFKGLREA